MFKRKKTNKILLLITFILFASLVTIYKINSLKNDNNLNSEMTTEDAISRINENYYDITFNVEEKIATVDGNEVNITELLKISEENLEELLSNDSFETFLSENLIGDIEYNQNSITVENPYSTKTLIVETSEESIFDNYEGIVEVQEIVENIYLVDYNNALETKQGYEDFQEHECIENIFIDHKLSIYESNLFSTQSVSSSNLAWGVRTTGMNNYSIKLNYENIETEVKVAILDTGIYSSHEAFSITENSDKLNFDNSYDYVNDDTDVSDDNGHGTQVAGVIAESTSNNVTIVPIKVMDSEGKGNLSDILEAINDVYNNVDIINLSLGMDTEELSEQEIQTLEQFFEKIYNSGTVVVCAAGNDYTDVCYPASSEFTLAASAINASGDFASFSNYGDEIDFALPGVNLTLPNLNGESSYGTVSGTSFACPFLSAAVSLVKTEYASYGTEDIVGVLKSNADDLGDEGKDEFFGYGGINFNNYMFSKPIIAKIEVEDTNWELDNTINVVAVCGNNMNSYAITTSEDSPSSWMDFDSSSTSVDFDVKTTYNGTNYVWIKDEKDNIVSECIEVLYIDNSSPIINDFSASDITAKEFELELSVQDNDSGLSKINWYYKRSVDAEYIETTDTYEIDGIGETGDTIKSHIFSELDSFTEYTVYAKIYDVVGNYIETEKINATTLGTVSIENKTGGQAVVNFGEESSSSDFSPTISEGKFDVTCDLACIVLITNNEEDTYLILSSTPTNNTNNYEFSFDMNENIKIIIALKGDINLSGSVNAADAMLIGRSKLSESNEAYLSLSSFEQIMADINQNGIINSSDAMLINRSLLSNIASAYLALEW